MILLWYQIIAVCLSITIELNQLLEFGAGLSVRSRAYGPHELKIEVFLGC